MSPASSTMSGRESSVRLHRRVGVARWHHADGRAVTENLGHAAHDLGRVVAKRDERIGAKRARMLDRERERIMSRALAQFGQQRDLTATKLLQRRTEGSKYRPRPDRDSAYDA